MMIKNNLGTLVIICYLIIGLLTFGYLQNVFADMHYDSSSNSIIESHIVVFVPAAIGGMIWPVTLSIVFMDFSDRESSNEN